MSKEIKVTIKVDDEEKTKKLMAKAFADITKKRIEKLPEHLRVEAYDILISKLKK
ncbi:hypothetical protein Curi_c28380 [Gottschalkia acidurici 9a]|uniref:Uncharacterized protein n=1 Tax=Gottschalkia acidurici (strain ATCC 7906 / DSM 604 / BCRC 14475 / CIP 104303 / KCTC 5404 / NCIMB 10678 / 9a) TaxID=1128398 RepID=K0B4I0_GOTA9|nr:hypothetical protein [Gottschalkia acidurici]AFS79830.1 hypothetical protein Curi_c28380 [Gottschalkia acidurici 9a]